EARFERTVVLRIGESHRSTPSHHHRYVLHAAREIRDRRRHDARPGVEVPQRRTVRCAIRDEMSVGATLKDEISCSREHATALQHRQRHTPYRTALDGI